MAVAKVPESELDKFLSGQARVRWGSYVEADYSQFDRSHRDTESSGNQFVCGAFNEKGPFLRNRVPLTAISAYLKALGGGFKPYISNAGPTSFNHAKNNIRGISKIEKTSSGNWCTECNYLVEADHSTPCFGDIAVKNNFVERAAWLGDSLIALRARECILINDGIDGVKYARLTSGACLASLYEKLKPFQAIKELVANGGAANTVADAVEAAYALSPMFSLIIQGILFGESSLSHIDAMFLETIRRNYSFGSIQPTGNAVGFGYLHMFDKYAPDQQPFISIEQLRMHDATPNFRSVYYKRIEGYCLIVNTPVKGFTAMTYGDIIASDEEFDGLLFC